MSENLIDPEELKALLAMDDFVKQSLMDMGLLTMLVACLSLMTIERFSELLPQVRATQHSIFCLQTELSNILKEVKNATE